MICPRCSVGEISDQSHECTLCGFSPTSNVLVESPFNQLEESTRRELQQLFQIEGVLGRGMRSVVYLALEIEKNRLVALKVIPWLPAMGPEVATRFQREAAIAASLDHPHIIPVYRYGNSRMHLWYAMEYCNSRSVGELLREGKPLEATVTLRIVQQIASALDYVHRRGITHGGLKPSNVLVDASGWARVGSFGMTRALGVVPRDPTAARYLARENYAARNLVGPSADQYALAQLTHDCLAGLPTLPPGVDAALDAGSAAPPPPAHPPVRLPGHVLDALHRATTERPADRFATILDFVAALEGDAPPPATSAPLLAVAGRRSPSKPQQLLFVEPAPPPPQPPSKVGRRLVLGTVALAAVGIAWWLFAPAARIAPLTPTAFDSGPTSQVAPAGSTRTSIPVAAAPAGSTNVAVTPPRPSPPPPRLAATTTRPPAVITPRRAAPIRAPGFLVISSTPWAELYIDGQLEGNTPKRDLPLAAGTHVVRLVRDGFVPYEAGITIATGATVRLTDIVLVEAKP